MIRDFRKVMIKNIIFDVGRVLVDVRWDEIMQELGFEGELLKRVSNATVCSDTWGEYDRGKWSDEEILNTFITNAPDLEREIRLFMEHEHESIKEFPYAKDWVKSFKDKGYHCYILSNYPRRIYENTCQERGYEEFVDGAVYSYQVHMIKPEPVIYQTLLKRYGLVPEECVFIDDNLANIEAARKLGIHAIHFNTRQNTEQELQKLGV